MKGQRQSNGDVIGEQFDWVIFLAIEHVMTHVVMEEQKGIIERDKKFLEAVSEKGQQ